MIGGVTRHMLPHLPHTWGPPPPCKQALSKKQGKLTKRPIRKFISYCWSERTCKAGVSRITNKASTLYRNNRNGSIFDRSMRIYWYTGIPHSYIIVFKKLRFRPLTRLQQNSVKESWTKNIFLVNTLLVNWPEKPVLKAAFLFNTLKAIVDISIHS